MEIDLIEQDLKINWHPCVNMKQFEQEKPLLVKRAEGCLITLEDDKTLIDATSSWMCKSLGHNHPAIKKAITKQMAQFEHIMFDKTSYELIIDLSKSLCELMPGLSRAYYAGDGSCAVEIALKMSLHYRKLTGDFHKNKIISFHNSYHGETIGALSVSDLTKFKLPYQDFCFDVEMLTPPYVNGEHDPVWHDANEAWTQIKPWLEARASATTAIIFEPIVQGGCGMKIYSPDFLSRLSAFAKAHNIHLIADEIMTGLGRTGKMLACEHANVTTDFVCLGKGLTAGFLPFSAVLTTEKIFETFYNAEHSFYHSHTYTGNALGAAAALATLREIQTQDYCTRAQALQNLMHQSMMAIADETGALKNIRSIGAICAADIHENSGLSGFTVGQKAIALGGLLRPIGNTVYWLPPLTISNNELVSLKNITQAALS